MNRKKQFQRLLKSPANVRFADLTSLAECFGFRLSRTRGSHRIYVHAKVPGLLNLQDVRGEGTYY